jgi:hypothetical protein
MMSKTRKTLVVETRYGTMKFTATETESAHEVGYRFREIIKTWAGFTEETRPVRIEEAVEYHLAYVEGGVEEVRHVMREREAEIRARKAREAEIERMGGMPRELWGMPKEVIEAEWAKRMKMGWYGW